jgi:lipase chaperone LimK
VLVSEQVFLIYLRARGEQNPAFSTQTMPHYPESSLSDEDARDIYAYILTFVDEPPAVDDIPALRTIVEDAEAKQ